MTKPTAAPAAWPQGTDAKRFYRELAQHRDTLTSGRVVVVDPASGSTSAPGYAVLDCGDVVENGELVVNGRLAIADRLSGVLAAVRVAGLDRCGLLVIERLRGRMVHPRLHWAAGVTVMAVGCEHVLEIPIRCWKAVAAANPAYAKGDAADALAMAQCVAYLARGLGPDGRPASARGRARAERRATKRAGGVRCTKRGGPGRVRNKRGRGRPPGGRA